jgi:RNA polymerase sigma factor (sigma-70 family)
MEVSGSIEFECERRLINFYRDSYKALIQIANKVTKNKESSEDIVMELMEYLHIKKNPKLWWGKDSYNIMYASKFIKHRYLNKTKKLNRITYVEEVYTDEIEIPYDEERDIQIQKAHDEVMRELKHLEQTKMWTSSKIFQLYWMSDKTLDQTAKDIGISKSTVFLSVKKIRKYLAEIINNPFDV